jgi:transcriptional regulator with XRE-family HTH domain
MDVRQLVGRNCRRLRLAGGLTQEALEEAGIDQALLSKIEAGKRNITLTTMDKLAKALGCRLVDLVVDDSEPAA